jgi:hypothetical protein
MPTTVAGCLIFIDCVLADADAEDLEDHWKCRALKSLAAGLPRLRRPTAMLDEIN